MCTVSVLMAHNGSQAADRWWCARAADAFLDAEEDSGGEGAEADDAHDYSQLAEAMHSDSDAGSDGSAGGGAGAGAEERGPGDESDSGPGSPGASLPLVAAVHRLGI